MTVRDVLFSSYILYATFPRLCEKVFYMCKQMSLGMRREKLDVVARTGISMRNGINILAGGCLKYYSGRLAEIQIVRKREFEINKNSVNAQGIEGGSMSSKRYHIQGAGKRRS